MTPTTARRITTDNPAIDQDWYDAQMDQLQRKLSGQFPHLDEETIFVALDLASERLATPARIPNYLPVLVGKAAREQLVQSAN